MGVFFSLSWGSTALAGLVGMSRSSTVVPAEVIPRRLTAHKLYEIIQRLI